MPRATQTFFVLALSLVSLTRSSDAQITTSAPPVLPQIYVAASGEVQVQPDRATMVFAVETRGQTATAAAAENARRQKSVTDILRGRIGTQDKLTTAGYSVSTDDRYDSGQRKVVGYIARNTVVLETRSPERVGSFIDAALANGSNVIAGLRFWSSAIDTARREALTTAVSRARADADAIARAAGGSLGQLLEIQSGSSSMPIVMETSIAMRSVAPETPITPSEQTVAASITARWVFVSGKD